MERLGGLIGHSVHKIGNVIHLVTSFKPLTPDNNVTYLYVSRPGKQIQKPNKPNKTTPNYINIL